MGVWLSTPVRKVVDVFVWWLVARGLGKAAHAPAHDASAVIHRIKQPMLFMHGTGDTVIHHDHTHDLFKRTTSSRSKSMWIAPDAEHTALFNVHPEEYERRVLGFLEARVREHLDGMSRHES
mmetsp:Transcript_2579/g.8860  ORF Transcript_2579/g.8860 Transcript_2579/m.8860 type:complete len:122 (+) Transcript_2579:733-1098(+)